MVVKATVKVPCNRCLGSRRSETMIHVQSRVFGVHKGKHICVTCTSDVLNAAVERQVVNQRKGGK